MFSLALFFINFAALSASSAWLAASQEFEPLVTTLGLIVSQGIIGREVFSRFSLLRKEVSFSIAILGDKYSGKSVYITSALAALSKANAKSFLSISDYETIEKLFVDIYSLRNGKWLDVTRPSCMGHVFTYKTHMVKRNRFLTRSVQLIIPDYSGEDFHSAFGDTRNSEWFHQNSYFRFVFSSDAIFLALDVSASTDSPKTWVASVEWQAQRLLAALHIYCAEKRISPSDSIRLPVCVIFLKADLVSASQRQVIEQQEASDLISFCASRCRKFQTYWVTSTGRLAGEYPPRPLAPVNVCEPIVWCTSDC